MVSDILLALRLLKTLLMPICDEIKLTPDHALKASLIRLIDKLERTEHVAMIGHSDPTLAICDSLIHKLADVCGTIK